MSRPIKLTPEYMEECRADFEKALQLTKLADGKINFTKTFSNSNRKAVVYFTPAAWAKMVILINEFEKEVAWHGVAHRVGEAEGEVASDNGRSEYIITDILVYPQTVSAATVEMDTEKYAEWLMGNIEDERFNGIRMQGHSHVRMAPSPSSVDLNHQEEILNMLGDDDFYIFMIWNKSFSKNCKVYDMRENTLFENGDVFVSLLDEVGSLDEFLKDAKDMVKDRVYSYQSQRSPYSGTPAFPGSQASGPYNPLAPTATNPPSSYGVGSSSDKKRGDKPRTRIGAGWYGRDVAQESMFDVGDDENPYNWGGQQ